MMRLGIITAALLLPLTWVGGQSLIGLPKEEVADIIDTEYREFRKDNSIIRQRFNYLKYVNRMRTKTWIIYFTDEDISKTSKLICDYGEYDDVIEDLSSRSTRTGESVWEYVVESDTFQVEVLKQEWYFTLRETRKESEGE